MNHSISTMTGKTKIKIVLLGNQAVGKSSLIQRYIHDKFQENSSPTVGIDFLAKNISHQGKNYRLQLWDTAGQQRFRSLIPGYLKDANCAIVVFDVTNPSSLSQAEMWINLYNENKVGQGYVFLVGNKIDLEYRQIKSQIGFKKAQDLGVPYLEVSAKTGQNLQKLFGNVIQVCVQKKINPNNFFMKSQNHNKKDIILQDNLQEEGQTKNDQTQAKIKNKAEKQTMAVSVVIPEPKNNQAPIVLKKEQVQQKVVKKSNCC